MDRSSLLHTKKNVQPLVLFRDAGVDHWSCARFQFRKISGAVDILRNMGWRACKSWNFEESPKLYNQPWLTFLVERLAGLDAFDRICFGKKHGIKCSSHRLGPYHYCHYRFLGAFSGTSKFEKTGKATRSQ